MNSNQDFISPKTNNKSTTMTTNIPSSDPNYYAANDLNSSMGQVDGRQVRYRQEEAFPNYNKPMQMKGSNYNAFNNLNSSKGQIDERQDPQQRFRQQNFQDVNTTALSSSMKLRSNQQQINTPERCRPQKPRNQDVSWSTPVSQFSHPQYQQPTTIDNRSWGQFSQKMYPITSPSSSRSYLASCGESLFAEDKFFKKIVEEQCQKILMKNLESIRRQIYQDDQQYATERNEGRYYDDEPQIIYSKPNAIGGFERKTFSSNNPTQKKSYADLPQIQPKNLTQEIAFSEQRRNPDFKIEYPQYSSCVLSQQKKAIPSKKFRGEEESHVPNETYNSENNGINLEPKQVSPTQNVSFPKRQNRSNDQEPLPSEPTREQDLDLSFTPEDVLSNSQTKTQKEKPLITLQTYLIDWTEAINIWKNIIRKKNLAITSILRTTSTLQNDCRNFLDFFFMNAESTQREDYETFDLIVRVMNGSKIIDLSGYPWLNSNLNVVFRQKHYFIAQIWSLFLESLNINNNDPLSLLLATGCNIERGIFDNLVTTLTTVTNIFECAKCLLEIFRIILQNSPKISHILLDLLQYPTYICLIAVLSAEIAAITAFQGISSVISVAFIVNKYGLAKVKKVFAELHATSEHLLTVILQGFHLNQFWVEGKPPSPPIFLDRISEYTYRQELSLRFGDPTAFAEKLLQKVPPLSNLPLISQAMLTPIKEIKPYKLQDVLGEWESLQNMDTNWSTQSQTSIHLLVCFLTNSFPLSNTTDPILLAKLWLKLSLNNDEKTTKRNQLIQDLYQRMDKELTSWTSMCAICSAILNMIVIVDLNLLLEILWPQGHDVLSTKKEIERETFFSFIYLQYQALQWTQGLNLVNKILNDADFLSSISNFLANYVDPIDDNSPSVYNILDLCKVWSQIRSNSPYKLSREYEPQKLRSDVQSFLANVLKSNLPPDQMSNSIFLSISGKEVLNIRIGCEEFIRTPEELLRSKIWSLIFQLLNIKDITGKLAIKLAQMTLTEFPEELYTKLFFNDKLWSYAHILSQIMKRYIFDSPNLSEVLFKALSFTDYICVISLLTSEANFLVLLDGFLQITAIFSLLDYETYLDLQTMIFLACDIKELKSAISPLLREVKDNFMRKPEVLLNFRSNDPSELEDDLYLQLKNCTNKGRLFKGLPTEIELTPSIKLISDILDLVIQELLPQVKEYSLDISRNWSYGAIKNGYVIQNVVDNLIQTKFPKILPLDLCLFIFEIIEVYSDFPLDLLWPSELEHSEELLKQAMWGYLEEQIETVLWSNGFYLFGFVKENILKLQEIVANYGIRNSQIYEINLMALASSSSNYEILIENNIPTGNLQLLTKWGDGTFDAPELIIPNSSAKFSLNNSPEKTGIWYRVVDKNEEELGFVTASFSFKDSKNPYAEGSRPIKIQNQIKSDIIELFSVSTELDTKSRKIKFRVGTPIPSDISTQAVRFSETTFAQVLGFIRIQNKTTMAFKFCKYQSNEGSKAFYWEPNQKDMPGPNSKRTILLSKTIQTTIYLEAINPSKFIALTFSVYPAKEIHAEGSDSGHSLFSHKLFLDAGLQKHIKTRVTGYPVLLCYELGKPNEAGWDSPEGGDSTLPVKSETRFDKVHAIVNIKNSFNDGPIILKDYHSENNDQAQLNWINQPHGTIEALSSRTFLVTTYSNSTINIEKGNDSYKLRFEAKSKKAEGSVNCGLQRYELSRSNLIFVLHYKIGTFNEAHWNDNTKPILPIDLMALELQEIHKSNPPLCSLSYYNILDSIVQSGPSKSVEVLDNFKKALAGTQTCIDIITFANIDDAFLSAIVEAIESRNDKTKQLTLRICLPMTATLEILTVKRETKSMNPQDFTDKTKFDDLSNKIRTEMDSKLINEISQLEEILTRLLQKTLTNVEIIVACGKALMELKYHSDIEILTENWINKNEPQSQPKPSAILGWNHQKLVVIDGGVRIFAGGMNLLQEFLDASLCAKQVKETVDDTVNDLSLIISGEVAVNAQIYIDDYWESITKYTKKTDPLTSRKKTGFNFESRRVKPVDTDVETYYIVASNIDLQKAYRSLASQSKNYPTNFCPTWTISTRTGYIAEKEPGWLALAVLLRQAKSIIRISQHALFYPTGWSPGNSRTWWEFWNILLNAVQDGVTVQILLSRVNDINSNDDGGYTSAAADEIKKYILSHFLSFVEASDWPQIQISNIKDRLHLRNLLNANKKPARNHAKFILVDDKYAYVGSQNLYPTLRPMKENDNLSYIFGESRLGEFGFIILDSKEAIKLRDNYFKPLWDRS